MRHSASMVATMEGVSRPVYQIARELAQNSRSGLTVRFLAKKLELPQEEIEYLVDVNHNLLFIDLTKVKLVAEGHTAVRRITDGLENRGDVDAIFRRVKSLSDHDFRRLEDLVGMDHAGSTKKSVAEQLIEQNYRHPESIVEYVATKGFSETAREVFDIVWQSKEGVMPVPKLRAAHGGSEYDIEQALWELFRGLALFEMFRFDAEHRLVRVAGLLSEIRQWREENAKRRGKKAQLRPAKGISGEGTKRGTGFSDQLCQLVAAIAAKPARLRGDGELFREDRRRLSEIVDEDAEPSLSTCLWAAQGVGWLARVDNELRAGELDTLVSMHPFDRHRVLFNWMMSTGNEGESRRILADLLDQFKPGSWYSALDFVRFALRAREEGEDAVLKSMGGHYRYMNPSTASKMDKALARSIEEALFWLGVVDHESDGGDLHFSISELGRCLLTGKGVEALKDQSGKESTEIIVQPNFDIVVPTYDMDPLLTVPLDQFAERKSTGQATVYHLSKDTFTAGLQEGHDGDAFVEFLVAHNRGGTLPANVMTTLDDWRGGLRRVRLRTITVLETDDPLVMADLMHRRKYKKYLSAVDGKKNVRYHNISKSELAKQLEKDGFIVE